MKCFLNVMALVHQGYLNPHHHQGALMSIGWYLWTKWPTVYGTVYEVLRYTNICMYQLRCWADVEYMGSNLEAAAHQSWGWGGGGLWPTTYLPNKTDFATSSQFYYERADAADLFFMQPTTVLCEQSSQGFCCNIYCTN